MQTLKFSIHINATAEKVWNSLWESENYQQWNGVLCVGRYFKTEHFAEGYKIQLLSPTGDGRICILEKVDPFKVLVFRHIGEIKNFQEQLFEENDTPRSLSMESYRLTATADGTELLVQIDTVTANVPHINSIYTAALQVLKKIAETKEECSYAPALCDVSPPTMNTHL